MNDSEKRDGDETSPRNYEAGERIRVEEKTSIAVRIWQAVFGIVAFSGLGWAFLQVSFFWRANQALYPSLVDNPALPSGIFSGLFINEWSFAWTNSPPFQIVQSLIVISMTLFLGVIVIRLLDVFPTMRSRIALGFIVGFGVSGWFFQLLIMSNLLYIVTSWILWVVMIFAALALFRFRDNQVVWRSWSFDSKPNPHFFPYLDDPEKVDRIRIDPTGPRRELRYEESAVRWLIGSGFLFLAGIICFITFWHSAFFPETYWDSLILYLGYARMTFLEHGFPIKVTGQVGIGLGANYPHIYSNYGAMVSTMFGSWSDFHQRIIPPLLQVCSAVLIYDILLMTFGRRFPACAGVLVFLSVPYGIAYFTFASNYCIAMAVTAAFLHAGCMLARSQTPGSFALFTMMPAIGMQINYLMGILWVPWAIMVFVSFLKFAKTPSKIVTMAEKDEDGDLSDDRYPVVDAGANIHESDKEFSEFENAFSTEVFCFDPPSPFKLLTKKTFWVIFLACMFMGSTWYVRNYIVTGNPVYAFFHEVFPNTKNLNPEVMESAKLEWFANGDGINGAALIYAKERFEEEGRNPENINALDAKLSDRLEAFYLYFQGFDIRRLDESTNKLQNGKLGDRLYYLSQIRTPEPPQYEDQLPRFTDSEGMPAAFAIPRNPQAYKFQPLFLGFFFPGLLIGMLIVFFPKAAVESGLQPMHRRCFVVLFAGCMAVVLALGGYHFILSDMYLYQIIPILIPLGIIGGFAFLAIGSNLLSDRSIPVLIVLFLWSGIVTMTAFVPGIAMSLRNFKVFQAGQYGKDFLDQSRLDIFRRPGIDPETIYAIQYRDDYTMWREVEKKYEELERFYENIKSKELLTHDNRHLMYDPEIILVHLDDWSIQQIWDLSLEDKVEYFADRGIPYYLRIENEKTHPILKRLELDQMIEVGYLRLVSKFGSNELYRFVFELEDDTTFNPSIGELETLIEILPDNEQ